MCGHPAEFGRKLVRRDYGAVLGAGDDALHFIANLSDVSGPTSLEHFVHVNKGNSTLPKTQKSSLYSTRCSGTRKSLHDLRRFTHTDPKTTVHTS